ncbi:hypothetical protein [Aquabacterium sp. OR-4]|uniref:hypothetical protein n=1 Tax=Aquabacterium sp. OR-4 TaxID=2978127 RepID=UPI0028CA0FBF|nr:hypothetical protein [Aquabacterium sp. OR-4]MDT7838950.1 hypothetical protein [Aquabacterium sp. OR-4]
MRWTAWRWQRMRQGARPGQRPAPAPPRPASAADPAAARREAEASRWLLRLAQPWPQVFGAAEAAAVPGVSFTGLVFDGQGPLRLEGQAADPAAALAAAQALRSNSSGDAAPSAWQGVTLSRLDSMPGGQRFEILAQAQAQAQALAPATAMPAPAR